METQDCVDAPATNTTDTTPTFIAYLHTSTINNNEHLTYNGRQSPPRTREIENAAKHNCCDHRDTIDLCYSNSNPAKTSEYENSSQEKEKHILSTKYCTTLKVQYHHTTVNLSFLELLCCAPRCFWEEGRCDTFLG